MDYQEKRQKLQTIQAGEKVHFYYSRVLDPRVETVGRVTPREIILKNGERFNRDGRRIKSNGNESTYILPYDQETEDYYIQQKADKRLKFFISNYDFDHAPIELQRQIAALLGYEG